jgi:hypothetical protein
MTPPSPLEVYERACRLANFAVWTIALQCRRLRSEEPEDNEFLGRRVADFQFLIIALTRLRRAAILATNIPSIKDEINSALNRFDTLLPMLKNMRDVAEHFDDYAIEKGRNRNVSRKSLEVAVFNDNTFQWLKHELNADIAFEAGKALFKAMREAKPT